MKDINVEFSRQMLRQLRSEAKGSKVQIPTNMTALKSGVGTWWLVEGDGLRKEVTAQNAYDAKCKVIEQLLKGASNE